MPYLWQDIKKVHEDLDYDNNTEFKNSSENSNSNYEYQYFTNKILTTTINEETCAMKCYNATRKKCNIYKYTPSKICFMFNYDESAPNT